MTLSASGQQHQLPNAYAYRELGKGVDALRCPRNGEIRIVSHIDGIDIRECSLPCGWIIPIERDGSLTGTGADLMPKGFEALEDAASGLPGSACDEGSFLIHATILAPQISPMYDNESELIAPSSKFIRGLSNFSYPVRMTEAATELPPSRDPLAETLHLLRLTGSLYCRSELSAPWNIALPALEGCMMFHIVTSGRVVLEVKGEDPVVLEQGGLALVPHGQGHLIYSSPDAPTVPLFDLPIHKVSERYEILEHGGGGARTQLICGVVQFDHVAAEQLIRQFPAVLQVDAWDEEGDSWLHSTIRFLAREARELRPGGETVMTRLADIVVVQMIRAWIAEAKDQDRGWFAALRDRKIGQALVAIHEDPGSAWTLERLARRASMSRSSFAARFSSIVGEPVMQYLTRWRMQVARAHLRDGTETMASVADLCGYRSEAAFCRAFKRIYGMPPSRMRKELAD